MPKFSEASRDKLNMVHSNLRLLMHAAIQLFDFTVIWGHRGEAAQIKAFETGHSEKKFGGSKHNVIPSLAVDIAPYPIDWEDRERFIYLGGIVRALAYEMGIPLRWGGDWDSDGHIKDHKLQDLGHFELVKEE